ncbi:MAG: beta-hydroxyacyl-ACP dehydratase [Paludibacteraceae bacterium]|mgnify:CR=1 FL=1|nr:beta-hydroxyacyl-ACP dehydratase [Paludibacteraceae bacterium]
MLVGDFFTIEQITKNENEVEYLTKLNANHEIYKGHFPGDPICPGVCNVQTIRECAELQIGKKLRIESIAHCRFAALITPQNCPQLLISLSLEQKEDGNYLALANITSPNKETIYLEYKGEYSIE